jgi:hypothetical protein
MAKYRIVKKYHKMCGDYFIIQRKFLFFWIPIDGKWHSSPVAAEGHLLYKKEIEARLKEGPKVIKILDL